MGLCVPSSFRTVPVSSLSVLASLISQGKIRRVVWLSGAGISASAGIPDFRSPGTGLYDNLQEYNLPYPEAVFDLSFFHSNPLPFFRLSKDLLPGEFMPTRTHCFIRLLYEKKILHRCWTQNIDGLERLAGIPPEKLVEAHGTFATSHCTSCGERYLSETMRKKILNLNEAGTNLPRCVSCGGIAKPDITFFGEDLPRRFEKCKGDFRKVDLLVVAGTSLQVQPFASLPDLVRRNVPRLLINREYVGSFRRASDVVALGECDDICVKLAKLIGWYGDLKAIEKRLQPSYTKSPLSTRKTVQLEKRGNFKKKGKK
eukprot:g693.t1